MTRVAVKPDLLSWARERSGVSIVALKRKFPNLEAWERGEAHPTLKQLEAFAKATYAPIGYLFLDEPPVETLPIPDFRTGRTGNSARLSPNLRDTIYLCQQRQNHETAVAVRKVGVRSELLGMTFEHGEVALSVDELMDGQRHHVVENVAARVFVEVVTDATAVGQQVFDGDCVVDQRQVATEQRAGGGVEC